MFISNKKGKVAILTHSPSISIVVPALNEEDNIKAAVNSVLLALNDANVKGEIIIINDGSTDNTGRIAEEMKQSDKRISVIHHSTPMGMGYSFWDGVSKANNEVVTIFGGDNEGVPSEYFLYLHLFKYVDIVVPFFTNAQRSALRVVISRVYSIAVKILLGLKVHHSTSPVLYRRSILNDINLRSHGFCYQPELLCKTIRRGYLYAEVPFFTLSRVSGKSSIFRLKSILNIVYDFSIIFLDRLFSKKQEELDPSSATVCRRKKVEKLLG